jgi:beta-glucosidase
VRISGRSTATRGAAGFVLTRNEDALLPLHPRSLRHLAVIGPNAAFPRTLGGGSATVFPPYRVSPLDGLRAALPSDAVIEYSPGVRSHTRIPLALSELLYMPGGVEHGVSVEFLAADGSVLSAEQRYGGFYAWRSMPLSVSSEQFAAVPIATTVRARAAGTHVIGCSGLGRFRLQLAGALAVDAYLTMPPGTDPTEAYIRPPQRSGSVTLQVGESVDIVLEHHLKSIANQTSFELGGVAFQLNIEEPHLPDDLEIARAVHLVESADAAVVVVGTMEEAESEGFDRPTLDLPGRQNELVQRVARANPRTVVIVNSGSPVLLPWAGTVPAILLTLFPGQEYGNALADVLLGVSEPGGRLPVTWPDSADDLPATTPVRGVLTYGEGLYIGYRQFDRDERAPRYPFGHGLGYSTWEYLAADVALPAEDGRHTGATADTLDSAAAMVRVSLGNTGTRSSRETIQIYASRPGSPVERPVRWLVAFAKAEAEPGAVITTHIAVPVRSLAHWDTAADAWAAEPGEYQLGIGRSSRDLPLTVAVTIRPGAYASQSQSI